jgi:hypothetical protein
MSLYNVGPFILYIADIYHGDNIIDKANLVATQYINKLECDSRTFYIINNCL